MIFEIGGYDLSFMHNFFLFTNVNFGDYFPAFVLGATFRSCVFPIVGKNVYVKLEHVVDMFENSLNDFSDADTVHICLLYMLKTGFNGWFRH